MDSLIDMRRMQTENSRMIILCPTENDLAVDVLPVQMDGTGYFFGTVSHTMLCHDPSLQSDTVDESAVLSPDGKYLAYVCSESPSILRIWDIAQHTQRVTYPGLTHGVNALVWSPNGQDVASASNDGTFQVWNIE